MTTTTDAGGQITLGQAYRSTQQRLSAASGQNKNNDDNHHLLLAGGRGSIGE